MGNGASTKSASSGSEGSGFPFWGRRPEEPEEPEEFVIVPPIIAMDRQEINRMAFSSYDWAHRKRELCVLMNEYLEPGATARINVVPPSDNRLLSSVNIMTPDVLKKGWRRFLADPSGSEGAWNTQADLIVRAHLTRDDPHSFVAFVLGANQGFLHPGFHFAAVPTSGSGPGLFGSIPLVQNHPEKGAQLAQLGVRYASQDLSAGISTTPLTTTIDKAWCLLRHTPHGTQNTHFTFGAQLEPQLQLNHVLQFGLTSEAVPQADQISTFLEYQSGAPDSYFSVLVEAERSRTLRFSIFQHLARLRRIYNLFEDDDVVGITNYLDFGVSVVAPMATEGDDHTEFEAAASWQVNSNVLVKSAVSSARLCAAFIFKSWWDPCFTIAVSAGWDFQQSEPCAGLSLHVDNDAELRYERGFHTTQTGGLVRQKHVATKAEGKVAHGTRLVVRGDKADRDASDEKLLVPPPVTHARSKLL